MIARPSTPIHVCVALAAILAVAGCRSPPDTVPAPSGLEATPTPVSPNPGATPSPPPSVEEAGAGHARYIRRQLHEYHALLRDGVLSSFPEAFTTRLNVGQSRIEIGVNCQSNLDRVRLALQEQLPSLGIPIEAVVFTLLRRPHPFTRPPGFECISAETIDPITGLSTPGFGGLYFQDDIVNVYLLEPSQEVAEELMIEELGRKTFESLQGVRAVQGTYTWTQLLEWYESIEDDIYKDSAAGMVTVDPGKNRLTIRVRQEYVDDAEREIVKAVLSRHGVPCEAVVLLLEDGTTRPPTSALCPP